MVSPETEVEIRRLFFAEHWKLGTIASELGLHHATVSRVVNTDKFVSRSRVVPSALDAHVAFVRETLAKHPQLRATRLHEMLRGRGYAGSARQVRRWVQQRHLRPSHAEAYLRLTTAPGEQVQVDWAHIGRVPVAEGVERPLYALVFVLSWSRRLYVDFSLDMSMAAVVRGHVRAFEAFGGTPRQCLYDNMKTVVIERMGDAIRYHPRLLELARHYAFSPRVCAPYRANQKGRVERAVRYLRESFLAARAFADLADARRQYAAWAATYEGTRPCRSDPSRTVEAAWQYEKTLLTPLPPRPLHATDSRAVCAAKQPYIAVDANLYSIPHDLVGRPLTLVVAEDTVEVYDGETCRARHARSYDRRKVIEEPAHIDALKAAKKAARHTTGRERILAEAPAAQQLYEMLVQYEVPIAPETRSLTLLLERYGGADLDAAIRTAVERKTPRASSVEQLLAGRARAGRLPPTTPLVLSGEKAAMASVKNHSLEDYDAFAD